jgi:dolichol-phosphate mannosyltransferase
METQAPYTIGSEARQQFGSLGSPEDFHDIIEGNFKIRSEIAVILPTYCESANVEKLIQEIEDLKRNICILIIDDSSPDGTSDHIRGLQKKYNNILLFVRPKKFGLGTAITDGFRIFLSLENPPRNIVTMDADYSHNPGEIPKLVKPMKQGYDLVVGSRYSPGGCTRNWSVIRLIISKMANLMASMRIGAHIRDYTSGFRCYSLALIKSIIGDLHSQTYEIQIETIRQAHIKGFNITEIPIVFANRKKGKSKLTFNEIKQFVSYVFLKK